MRDLEFDFIRDIVVGFYFLFFSIVVRGKSFFCYLLFSLKRIKWIFEIGILDNLLIIYLIFI